MIVGAIRTKPRLTFGLGITSIEMAVGDIADVWIEGEIDKSLYSTSLAGPGFIRTRISDKHYRIEFVGPETYLQAYFIRVEPRLELKSNILNIIPV